MARKRKSARPCTLNLFEKKAIITDYMPDPRVNVIIPQAIITIPIAKMITDANPSPAAFPISFHDIGLAATALIIGIIARATIINIPTQKMAIPIKICTIPHVLSTGPGDSFLVISSHIFFILKPPFYSILYLTLYTHQKSCQ